MDLREILAIDTMCRPRYFFPEAAKRLFQFYEFKIMAGTTFGGIARRKGLKPGEEWRVLEVHHSVEELTAEMDEAGIEFIFIDPCIIWSRHDHNIARSVTLKEIVKFIEESKGRIVGGAGYNPFRIRESIEEIEVAVKEFRFKYVWFHPASFGLRPDDRKCYPLYEKCIELEIPCCYQTGHSAEPLPSEPGRPMCADEVAMDFPELTLILTHTGWPWVQEWISMVWRHPNVYGNIGAYFPSTFSKEQVEFLDGGVGRAKVLWATNAVGLTRHKKEFLELPIRDEAKRKILRDNAIKVFKLPMDNAKI